MKQNYLFKDVILICILVAFSKSSLLAQDYSVLLLATKTHPNKNLVEDSSLLIPMVEISLSEHVYNFFLDSTLQKLYLRTRQAKKKRYKKNGHLATLDLVTLQFDWQEKINYKKTLADIKNRYMIRRKGSRNIMVDLITGKEIWEVRNSIYYTFTNAGIAIGYKNKTLGQDLKNLQGIDMTNGRILWEREIDRTYGWREMFSLSDSTIIVSGGGIHFINCKNGKGWTIPQKNGIDKSTFWSSSKRFYNIGSNIVRDTFDNSMYQAAEEVIKFNDDGKVLWRSDLPIDQISKMFLFQDERYVYLVNTGGANEAVFGYKSVGQAYTCIIDKKDGTVQSLKEVSLNEKDYIYGAKVISSEKMVLLSNDELFEINPSTGELTQRLNLVPEVFGEKKQFAHSNPYLLIDDSFKSVMDQYSFGLYNSQDETYHYISKDRNFIKFKSNELYFKLNLSDTIDLYYGVDKESYFINSAEEVLAKSMLLYRPVLIGSKLYTIKEKQLFIHDIESILSR